MNAIQHILIMLNMQVIISLRDVRLHLPSVVSLGERVPLRCSSDVQGEKLYSVKLYKGRNEFLRFVPEYSPPHRIFALRGVTVHTFNITTDKYHYAIDGNLTQGADNNLFTEFSTNYQVHAIDVSLVLENTDLYSTGLYGCEISADKPSYDTKIDRKKLQVFVEPTGNPVVSGFEESYKSGDRLNLTCTSRNSYPAANVTWLINDNQAPKDTVITKTVRTEASGLLTTISNLNIIVDKIKHAYHKLKVKCISSVLTNHWLSKDVLMQLKGPLLASIVSTKDNEQTGVGMAVKPFNSKDFHGSSWLSLILPAIIIIS